MIVSELLKNEIQTILIAKGWCFDLSDDTLPTYILYLIANQEFSEVIEVLSKVDRVTRQEAEEFTQWLENQLSESSQKSKVFQQKLPIDAKKSNQMSDLQVRMLINCKTHMLTSHW